ncbi:MAG: DUF1893 domain-containing protein [Clostridiales bacterium]|jgi:hypothetical protein|nr:DUF1893 domain-containing protein [Clostridiales bacterium]
MEWETVRKNFAESGACCLVLRGEERYVSSERGIRPLLGWLRENPRFFENACAADKIVGRAAALLLVYGGVRQVYAETLSDGAAAVLETYGVPFSCGVRAPFIRNREGTGMCPMEQKVRQADTPQEAYAILSAAVPV